MLRQNCITRTGHVVIAAFVLMLQVFGAHSADNVVPAGPESSFDFAEVDSDGNGCIEGPEEMQLFRLKVGSILGAALQLGDVDRALRAGQITHSADVNGDGRICECDLLSILLTETNGAGRHRHAFRVYEDGDVFDSVDTDQDGFLGDDTEKAAMTEKLAKCVPVDKARMVMDAMGQLKDDDGKVSREEYLLFLSPDAYPQAPVQPLPSQASANPKLPPAASPGQPAPQQNLPRPYPVLPAVEVADPVLSAAQPGPVEARSSGEPQPAAPREAANQPQLFKLPPQPNQLNALRRPVFSQPAASIPQPFRPVPLLQPVRGHPGAFRPLNLKHFLQSQQGGMPPAVPANFGRPVMASQWLQQAQQPPQPIVSDSQSQDAKSDSHDQPQDSEEELQDVLAHERERAAANHILHQQSAERGQQPRDLTQPMGSQEKAVSAVEEGKEPEALADLDSVASSLKKVE